MAELEPSSYWAATSSMSRYPALDRDLTVDVAVIGAGITGLTAAYLLKRAGRTVAVIDRGRCGGVDSSLTTAHVTCVTDADLTELVDAFGRDHAWAVWDAGLAAIEQIDRIVRQEAIDCEWTWVNGYKHAEIGGNRDYREALRREAQTASDLGFEARYLEQVPFAGVPGVEFGGQAKFHPRKYLSALTKAIAGALQILDLDLAIVAGPILLGSDAFMRRLTEDVERLVARPVRVRASAFGLDAPFIAGLGTALDRAVFGPWPARVGTRGVALTARS